ncbi:extensin-like [Camponotus floridanus]|uniref:extensin-like n=1 Tax=Camponotus floridanus TaxID=104421 RepID=UPI00059CA85C|nr:extensin-like [Camponotus floridanus]
MKVNVTLIVVLALGLVDAARRRVRSTTATVTTTPASFVNRQFAFVGQPEEVETLWENFDIQKLDDRSEILRNASLNHDEAILSKQYPGLPSNPGDTNELPSPILPPIPPSQKPPPGCQGPRGQYPSPKSCANYLNCWDDVVIEQTCLNGLLFNDVAGYCDFPFNVNCGDRPPATPKPSLPPESKYCPDPNERYRSSTNCSEFYVCVAGKPTKFSCPRSLVYNDVLNVCDYLRNVDCKGAATPNPPKPTQPPTQSSQTPTQPSQSPTQTSQPPTQPSQSPTQISQSPSQPSPTNPPQPPIYPPQPAYPPQPPIYQPQPYPPPPPSYSRNPWLGKVESDPWHQRSQALQLEINKENPTQEATDNQLLNNRPTPIVTETSDLVNSWPLFQVIPSELANTTCNNGDVHKLNDACTNVVVCRNSKPQMVRCSTGFSYDKPSDSCRPFNIAKC